MICTRCEGTGFINLHQTPDYVRANFDETGDHEIVLSWIDAQSEPHDVSVCDCCGNCEGWYGEPGQYQPSKCQCG